MLLVKRFINTVRKCRPPGKRLASRTWKRADSPSASEQEIHKPQRPFGRLLFTLRPGGFFGPRRICGCKGTCCGHFLWHLSMKNGYGRG